MGPLIQGTFAKAYKAGVKIAFGTDAGVYAHGKNWMEFIYMTEAGMPALEAIKQSALAGTQSPYEQERMQLELDRLRERIGR